MNLLKNTFFGFVLIAAMAVLLFWNEGRAVKTARALAEGSGIVIEVVSDKVDPANEGKLVHVAGVVVPSGPVVDPQFQVKAEAAVRLVRHVEMYQWKEVSRDVERTNSDGSKTTSKVYDYVKEWSATPIDSGVFKTVTAPRNPAMPAKGDSFDIDQVAIGAFEIGGSRLAYLGKPMPLVLRATDMPGVSAVIGGMPVWLDGNEVYAGADRDRPEIGDLRIRFEKSILDKASVVAAQRGQRLEDYTASNGRDIFLVQAGTASAAEMFKDAIASNAVLTWLLRGVGFVVMFVGFMMAFSLLTQTLGLVPGVGAIVRGGAGLMALGLTAMLGSFVIALGWVFYRPLLGLAILLAGVAVAVATGFLGRGREAAAPGQAKA